MKLFLELAKSEGLQNIKLIDKKSELTITFNTVQSLSKINKIGQSFKSAFGSEKIGWGSDWITIIK
jgi:predicted TIM-barrel fold metal-dependent hydrolase